ncbi:MAG TPA: ABC transporter permease [Mycobacteriales bacterium]|nr:ABC transporter permease [Mycobacteriales bacterium]
MTAAYWAVHDAAIMAKRTLLQIPRVPELFVFSTIQPVMFVLLFVYVFGGAIQVPGVDYVDFLMPGIFVQTVAFTSGVTAVGLAEDLQKGIIDRFRSLPMARSAVLAGRTVADTVRNACIVLVMVVVGASSGSASRAAWSRPPPGWRCCCCSRSRSPGSAR